MPYGTSDDINELSLENRQLKMKVRGLEENIRLLRIQLGQPAEEPLPCPFCGGTDLFIEDNTTFVRCSTCEATSGRLSRDAGIDEIYKHWNRRAGKYRDCKKEVHDHECA